MLNKEWMAKLAYMADIFSLLNEFNIPLQGSGRNIFRLRNKMDAFKKKLSLWDNRIKGEDMLFPHLGEFLIVADVIQKVILNIISQRAL